VDFSVTTIAMAAIALLLLIFSSWMMSIIIGLGLLFSRHKRYMSAYLILVPTGGIVLAVLSLYCIEHFLIDPIIYPFIFSKSGAEWMEWGAFGLATGISIAGMTLGIYGGIRLARHHNRRMAWHSNLSR
jgi:hypothetical protein